MIKSFKNVKTNNKKEVLTACSKKILSDAKIADCLLKRNIKQAKIIEVEEHNRKAKNNHVILLKL